MRRLSQNRGSLWMDDSLNIKTVKEKASEGRLADLSSDKAAAKSRGRARGSPLSSARSGPRVGPESMIMEAPESPAPGSRSLSVETASEANVVLLNTPTHAAAAAASPQRTAKEAKPPRPHYPLTRGAPDPDAVSSLRDSPREAEEWSSNSMQDLVDLDMEDSRAPDGDPTAAIRRTSSANSRDRKAVSDAHSPRPSRWTALPRDRAVSQGQFSCFVGVLEQAIPWWHPPPLGEEWAGGGGAKNRSLIRAS